MQVGRVDLHFAVFGLRDRNLSGIDSTHDCGFGPSDRGGGSCDGVHGGFIVSVALSTYGVTAIVNNWFARQRRYLSTGQRKNPDLAIGV